MSFFRRKPLADANQQQPASGANEGKHTGGFFSSKVGAQQLRSPAHKENEQAPEVAAGTPKVATQPALKDSNLSGKGSRIVEASSGIENIAPPPRAKMQAAGSGSAPSLFRASFENRVSGKRPREQQLKRTQLPPTLPVTSTDILEQRSDNIEVPATQSAPAPLQTPSVVTEPKAKSPRRGSSRRSVIMNSTFSARGPSFDDSYNRCWETLESNRDGMSSVKLDLMDARLLLANRYTDLLKEDVEPTLGPRLLACMSRVQDIRGRIGQPRSKTQYSPVSPASSNGLPAPMPQSA